MSRAALATTLWILCVAVAASIVVRARYISERAGLLQVGADAACFEELEAAVALARSVLFDRGVDAEQIRREVTEIRQSYGGETEPAPS